MLELIAQGKTAHDRWRKVVLQDLPFVVGRSSHDWSVAWDEKISRSHARLKLNNGKLEVEKLASATNPVFYQGAEKQQFSIYPGEHFVIGDTTFTLANDSAFATLELPSPISQRAFKTEFLRQVRYRNADHRIAVLNRLPEIISSSNNEEVLLGQMVNLLLAGIVSSSVVAICELDKHGEPHVIKWDQRKPDGGDFQPCSRLIMQAIENQQSTLHMWRSTDPGAIDYTVDLVNDWAFVCPLTSSNSRGIAIYVTGLNRRAVGESDPMSDEVDLQGDVKFAELVGATLSNLRRVQRLERRQSTFRAFFSPVVMEAFVDRDPEDVLKPRECEISVLFCDLRGFSAKSEEMSDRLDELLDRVSQALGIMTQKVLDFGGVIGDFHGDSAMGFWGWPLEKEDSALSACRAALEIQKELNVIAQQPSHRLHDFRMGIGVATGNAVAGKIGTSHQVKVTAFGPVVNLAARLEGVSGRMKIPILIDGRTADSISSFLTIDSEIGIRSLGKFCPFGLNVASRVSQLFYSKNAPEKSIVEKYAASLRHFETGNWEVARQQLENLPADDPASAFLMQYMNERSLDSDFDGTIKLSAK